MKDTDEDISTARWRVKPGALRRAQFVFEKEEGSSEALERELEEENEEDDDEFDRFERARGHVRRRSRRSKKNSIGVIDEGLIAYFKAPRSFTGEDVCELHMHGSIAVCKKILEVLSTMSGGCERSESSFQN